MSGKPLSLESRAMADMVSYLAFLSKGMPQGVKRRWLGLKKLPALHGNSAAGAAAYTVQCARCHGPEGAGATVPLAQGGGTVYAPPVWGSRSFSIGAGMARLNTAAAFIRWNMPYDRPGTL